MKQNLEKRRSNHLHTSSFSKEKILRAHASGHLKRSTITNKIIYYYAKLDKNYCFSSKKEHSEICMGTKTMTCWVTVVDSHLSQHGAIFSATDS